MTDTDAPTTAVLGTPQTRADLIAQIHAYADNIDDLAARLRAAEERERALTTALKAIREKAFEEDRYAWHHGVLEPEQPGWFWSVANDALTPLAAAANHQRAAGDHGDEGGGDDGMETDR